MLGPRPVHDDQRFLGPPHAAASSNARRNISPAARQVKRGAWASPRAVSSSRRAIASSMAAAIAAGIVGIGPHGSFAARLVDRRVRGRHDRAPTGHGFQNRDPEALEARRVHGDCGAAVEARELVVRHEAEAAHARAVEQRLLAPPLSPDHGEQKVTSEELMRLEQRLRGSCAAPASPP